MTSGYEKKNSKLVLDFKQFFAVWGSFSSRFESFLIASKITRGN
jgi:hypothetical protein